ncbi:MAG: hypothetical protein IKB59_02535, partial [Alphaproteobacteria bacterium]|nr:hypothetical protein [Alphaproteobacteria bacterium]
TGNIENSGAGMIIDATGAVVVDGTMKNSVGKMIIDAASLTVSGGSGSEPSFFNNGDLVLNISGDVTLAHGFDLNMLANQYGNSFRLLAGGLNLGVTDSNFFANELNSYSVTINNDYVAGSVSNGLANENATMYLAANNLTVGGVKNKAVFDSGASTGTMMLVAKTGVLTTGAIEDREGAETTLQANSKIQISGGVNVSGDLFASAPVINVGASDSAENIINGGTLSLRASNSSIGQILVYGDVSNSGDVDIVGREMAVFGTLTNQSGSIDIDGSVYNDSFVTIGGINISGGIINIDTTDGVEIAQTANFGTGTFVVSDGVVNLKENVHSLNLTASSGGLSTSVNVAGNMIATATAQSSGAGDVNVLASGVDNFTLTSNGDISVGGNVLSVESDLKARDINLVSQGRNIKIGGNVSAETSGNDLSFDAEQITIDGNVSAGDYASVSLLSNNITVGGLTDFVTQGTGNVINGLVYVAGKQIDGQKSSLTLTADKSGIVINNGLAVGSESAVTGLAIDNSNVNNVTLASTASGADITIASGISNAADVQLILGSKRDVVVSG